MKFQHLRYLGHSAVLLEGNRLLEGNGPLEGDSFVVAIDPWLQDNPLCPDSWRTPERIDLIVLTHGHSDHASDTVRLQRATGATVAATFELASLLAEEGVAQDKLVFMNKGGTTQIGPVRCTLTHAFHSSSFDTKNGPRYAGEPCGVVLSDGATTVYHAGDTAIFSDMALIGRRYRPQVACLPIGDLFTMGQEEGAEAAKLVGAKIAVPIHYRTFGLLEQNADQFRAWCASLGIRAEELEPGSALSLENID